MLNQKFSKFSFNFPKGFLLPEVETQFLSFIKRMPLNYTDSLSYLNSTIQGVSFPGFQAESSEQRLNREPVSWKDGIELHTAITKEITITFKLHDGMLNWFMLFLNTEYFMRKDSPIEFFPDFIIRILDSQNQQMFSVQLIQPRITAMSEATMSFTNNDYNAKEFTAVFAYNRYQLRFELD